MLPYGTRSAVIYLFYWYHAFNYFWILLTKWWGVLDNTLQGRWREAQHLITTFSIISWRHDWTFIRLYITNTSYVFNHKLTSQIELSTLWPFWHFLTVFALMTAALFCYFFTFLLKKGVQKRVPQNRLIIRKTHFMGGTLKNRGHILWFFTRDSWVGHTSSCPSQKSLFFRT